MAEDLDVEAMLEAPYKKDVCIYDKINISTVYRILFSFLFYYHYIHSRLLDNFSNHHVIIS